MEVRLAEERDVEKIAEIYRDVYGDDYPFKELYDTQWIKRGIFDREIRWFVAATTDGLLGSAAVMLNAGDADDLVAELGRLVVHPRARGMNLGTRLVDALVERAANESDFIFAEARTAHVGSQVILERSGFVPVGIEPLAYELDGFETMIFMCRLSDAARALRRGNPRVIPAVHELAALSLTAVDIEPDAIVEPLPAPHPVLRDATGLELRHMDAAERIKLLRLGREHFMNPEVFGAFRLEHGHLKLKQHAAEYLVLARHGTVLGGLGYTFDEVEKKLFLFELVAADPAIRGTLLERGIARLESALNPRYLSVDVNAHATATQQSLALLGFVPVTYAPSMVFVLGERFDVIRMVKLRQEPKLSHWQQLPTMNPVCATVEAALFAAARGALVDDELRRVRLFDGLSDVEVAAIAALCRTASYADGERLFRQGDEEQNLVIVVEGTVEVEQNGTRVAQLGAGDTVGEMALIERQPRSATAVARGSARVLHIAAEDFDQITTQAPALGLRVTRNLALQLSERLRATTRDSIPSGSSTQSAVSR